MSLCDIGWTTDGATYHDPQPGDDGRIMWVFRSKGLRTRLLAESATAARELIALRDAAASHPGDKIEREFVKHMTAREYT